MLLNCGAAEDCGESLGLQGDPTSQSERKSTLNIHWEDWWWSWSSSTLAIWCKQPIHWKGPWCWERLRAGGEEGDKGWGGRMASPTQWIWVWANSRRQGRTGKPGMLQSTGSQRVKHNLVTEQVLKWCYCWSRDHILEITALKHNKHPASTVQRTEPRIRNFSWRKKLHRAARIRPFWMAAFGWLRLI